MNITIKNILEFDLIDKFDVSDEELENFKSDFLDILFANSLESFVKKNENKVSEIDEIVENSKEDEMLKKMIEKLDGFDEIFIEEFIKLQEGAVNF